MKFNVTLSQEDMNSHKNALQQFGQCDSTDIISACLRIFEKTFGVEHCNQCQSGLLEANHLSYYNIIVKQCSNCGHTTSVNLKQH